LTNELQKVARGQAKLISSSFWRSAVQVASRLRIVPSIVFAHWSGLTAIAASLARSRSKDNRAAWSLLLLVVLFACLPVFAQTNVNEEQGMKPHDSWHGGDLDSISMTNGAMLLHAPLACFPQRGGLKLCFTVHSNTKQWQKATVCQPDPSNPGGQICTSKWEPLPRGGLLPPFLRQLPNLPVDGAYVASSLDVWLQSVCQIEPPDPNSPGQTLYDWSQSIIAPDGNVHQLANVIGAFSGPTFPLRSLNASGFLQPSANAIIAPNGTRFTYPSPGGCGLTIPSQMSVEPTAVTDANGNQVTINSSTGAFTDTMGRSIPAPPGTATSDLSACPSGTVSAKVWTVPGIGTGARTFKFCYSNVSIYTSFGDGSDYPATNSSLLSAIILPDSTQWTLSYDHWGNVTRLGFPTGGSVSYTYALGPQTCIFSDTQMSLFATSRTVDANDGIGGHQWTYTYSGQIANGAYSGTTVVTSPDGNDTVHTITSPVTRASCSLYDTQVLHYQGPHNGGALLQTAATQYSGVANPLTQDGTAINVVATQATTTSADGHTGKAVSTYDSGNSVTIGSLTVPVVFGSVLQKDEYDFSNTLVRSALNHYLWQDNATYKSNNFLGLPVSTTLKDGAGTQMAQTTMAYDQTAVTSSGIATGLVAPPAGGNIRGNATTASHWLNTSNSFLSSTATYFDTGMKASSTDPKGNTTTYTYSSTFAGAYMTQTNMPDTQMPDTGATLVHHVISGNYDFNTGLLTSFTDENSQAYSYQYDPLMLRLTQGNHPDGGQTIFTYPDPLTVQRQRLITGSMFDSFTAKFDGLGRPIQSQQVTPSGTILADTTYDIVGRVSTVSNPYYQGSSHGSDLTYGVITTQYDALSRAIKTIKQDGSFSTVQYNAPAGDGAGSSVVCTTAVDEAGKPRQVCADALGRMVKVLEPNPGAAATNATGWVAVSGSEQSANSQPATSGTGSVTISGTEQGRQSCFRNRCITEWDGGTVTVTVNGFSKSVSYGQADTSATVASNLAGALNGDGSSPVNASASGNVLTLTAKAAGSASNYSFSSSSATRDTSGTFSGPSFIPSDSGPTFTGGQDASSTPDTGTVGATINGTAYAVTYGAGDTPSSIATRLATAISGGSLASASASGGTINLTSKTGGTVGDYSLAASYTWNSSQFNQPSFTTSTSGGNLTGGYNASDLANNPYVTLYQYNVRNDLLCVHQKATDTTADVACTGSTPPSVPAAWRQRFFTYDSFSRLITALNPETGQTSFQYDNNSNLTSKTSPAPNQTGSATVTTTYTYDALNRPLDKSYSDGTTASASFRYDYSSYGGLSIQNPVGKLVVAFAANQANGGSLMSYDPMGRVIRTYQAIPGVGCCPTMTASYDQLGDPISVTYPANNFTVTYGYDTAARLTGAIDSNGVTYAQSPTILASGIMQEFTSPNFNNNKFHADYNNRLQPTEIWAGPMAGANALFDKKYSYNAPNTTQMNNGNVYTVTNVKDDNRTQSFTYDALNRLLTAGDKTHWSNSYVYDAWGNLYQKNPGSPAGENMVKTADTNNRLSGMSYDAAGNVTNDGLGNTFVYDAENRIISVANSGVTTTYVYDAVGRRIKKSSGSTATNYWFGPGGETLAETDASGNWTNYIFFGGQRLARNIPQPSPNPADIKYYITDHLHSTAMFVDRAGTQAAILDDNDFYPWGGVVPGVGATSSNNRYKFTGKERDNESGLDYFGARYYANVTSRFMSPDWAAKPTSVPYAEFGDPQSLNLYAYTRNSPIVRVDADGHDFVNPAFQSFDDADGASNIESTHNHMSIVTTTTTTTTVHLPSSDGTTPGPTVTTTTVDIEVQQVGVPGSMALGSSTTVTTQSQRRLTFNTIEGGPHSSLWKVQWKLTKKSQSGGWIVQEDTVTDASGKEVIHFWEAWRVPANSQVTIYNGIIPYDDSFIGLPSGDIATTKARFYEGLQLPSSFIANNPATYAGILPSTTVNPKLPTTSATAPVVRTWTVP
jgi:RHS repeat-associated protein